MNSKALVKATPKPLLLKDYLLDDLSSCSSNGFRTYPRRQCCTTVRFLLEVDMKNKQAMYKKKPPKLVKNRAKSQSSSTISAFQKASEALLNAVKHFPFTACKSTSSSTKLAILPRSLSRRLLKKSFWKKNDCKEIERWKPSAAEEKSEPFTMRKDTIIVDSNTFTSESNSKKSDSWSDSDFTITTTSDDSSGKFSLSERKNDVVLSKKNVVNGKRVDVAVGHDCDSMDATTSNNSSSSSTNSTNSKKAWTNEGEKEQFSPLSVLDSPFDDEDEVSSSPFRHRLAHVEGTTKKLMQRLQRFESLAELEPLNLEKRIALTESDHESVDCPEHNATESDQDNFVLDVEEYEEAEEKPLKLLLLVKATMPSYSSKPEADNLLLDFFRERITNGYEQRKNLIGDCAVDNERLSAAKDWINGQNRKLLLEWEVQKNRQAYIRDMEKTGEWKNMDEENKEVSLELEDEIFASLMNELLDDLLPTLKTV